jgi:uncharacterized repeat protein (TIGR03803 family)
LHHQQGQIGFSKQTNTRTPQEEAMKLSYSGTKATLALAVLWALGPGMFAPPAAKAQTLTTLYNFCSQASCTDGNQPLATLAQGTDGNFYGTTAAGGSGADCKIFGGCGTVFKITPQGTFTKIYDFCSQANCADGSQVFGTLVQGSDGNFYGTTETGGQTNPNYCAHIGEVGCGTVFKITPEGALTTLYTFCSQGGTNCTDGSLPTAGLVEGSDGNFYGTTASGGTQEGGTVFQITPSGTLTTIYNFCGLGSCHTEFEPGGLVQGSDGNFYGTAYTGSGGGGAVFKVTPSGTLTTLYSFCSLLHCTDGENPASTIVLGIDGNFYGTTSTYGGFGNPAYGGTVFKITPEDTLTTLDSFCLGCATGDRPYGSLIQATDGNFYGTALFGGTHGTCGPGGDGCGTVYKVTPGGVLTALYGFCSVGTYPTCLDGTEPYGGLVQGTDYNFYGTTSAGGTNGGGTVFVLAASPLASVSLTSLTFASQYEGTTSTSQPLTLSNTGPAPLAISSIGTSGDFAQTNTCGGSVVPAGSCTINVTFTPTQTGTRTGALTITDNTNGVSGSQQTVSLTGTGINPAATLSPASVAFGDEEINTPSAVKKVKVTSSGTTNLSMPGITIAGANAADFSQTNRCTAASYAPGATCTIFLKFTPSLLAAESATLTVTDNAANSPQTVALTGTGVMPVVLSPTSLSFGNIDEGVSSATKTVTMTNYQKVALTGISVSTSSTDYTQTNTCGTSIDAGKKCTITVTFTPSIIGADNATLSITDSASNSPQTAALTGTGLTPVKLTPTSETYPSQTVGTTSNARVFTLTSMLEATLDNIVISPSGDFTVSSTTCGTTLAAKGKCTIDVVFTPSATGTRTGTLSVSDSAANSPQTSTLKGTGK